MEKYQGVGIGEAIAIGKLRLLRRHDQNVKCVQITDAEGEKDRFRRAKTLALRQLQELLEKSLQEAGRDSAAVFEAHQMILLDKEFDESVFSIIDGQNVNTEYAVKLTAETFAERFAAMCDVYMTARATDVRDISDRLIRILSGAASQPMPSGEKVILCADDLTPSEAASLNRDRILAFVTAGGSFSSHTAILARGRNIPAVIGVGDKFLREVKEDDEAIVDGGTGEIIVNPDKEIRKMFSERQRTLTEKARLLQDLKGMENVTLDGKKIDIYANIGDVEDAASALANDAGGIGLFRSEFLFLERTDYPSEEEQFAAYKKVLEDMAGKKVIIRTIDIGADKQADYFRLKKEENPALGCRAIRLCLLRPEIFRTQLRALYRASVYGNLGIMFPMITAVSELEKILAICGQVKAELKQQEIRFSDRTELGIMIETPAAALISDKLACMADFFSVGTNDLTQYTLACDRQNPDVKQFADPHHEAVLRLIEMSAESARRHGIRIGICGELAADTTLTEAFLRMGIDELSVSPDLVLKVRRAVRGIDLSIPAQKIILLDS